MPSSSASTRSTLLLVDDEAAVLDVITHFAEREGFRVIQCAGGGEALEYLRHHRADVAVIDLHMPDVGGLDVLRAIRTMDPECQVMLISGDHGLDSAIEAIKLGAIDYLTKPINFQRLAGLLKTVQDERAQRRRLLDAEVDVAKHAEFCGMIGRSQPMQELFGVIRRLAPHVRTALVTGETGTGKELVARALHRMGPRRSKPFITINCAAVVETLFESELFGHMRGAFTGAATDKAGLFEAASGGTIFLDEVGELPLGLQAKLLRVLESGEVQRVGSIHPRRVDVHVLAATNRDLRAEVAHHRFRRDLLYRLNVATLQIPPLRERREDIPCLAAAFIREFAGRLGKPLVGCTAAAERTLISSLWYGNVRELRNVLERACILTDGELITERDLESTERDLEVGASAPTEVSPQTAAAGALADAPLSTVERQHIIDVLERVKGNKTAAAKILGLSRWALTRRMDAYGIDPRAPRSEKSRTA